MSVMAYLVVSSRAKTACRADDQVAAACIGSLDNSFRRKSIHHMQRIACDGGFFCTRGVISGANAEALDAPSNSSE
jgi:hypothetical protein